MTKLFVAFAAVFGAIGVATGAFGAHGLEDRLDAHALQVWQTASEYQMYHALALLGTAWLAHQAPSTSVTVAGWCFIAGILLFSGSLYILALTDASWWGRITPFGGLSFIVGWIALVVASFSFG